ncbi:MAG: acyltransferase [Planctomycetota bacterium]|jgi:acetyltransferase-like isoleucine patch superfamily enzyme
MSDLPEDAREFQSGLVDVQVGEAFTIVHPSNLYGCTFGDNCFVGPFVEVQCDVSIGSRTRIQSHTFICEQVSIGEDCFIAHGVMFINDLFQQGRPSGDPAHWKATHIGNHVSIGSNATILPVSICDHVVIGAGAVVTKDITEPGIYAGNPAKLLRPLNEEERA